VRVWKGNLEKSNRGMVSTRWGRRRKEKGLFKHRGWSQGGLGQLHGPTREKSRKDSVMNTCGGAASCPCKERVDTNQAKRIKVGWGRHGQGKGMTE